MPELFIFPTVFKPMIYVKTGKNYINTSHHGILATHVKITNDEQ